MPNSENLTAERGQFTLLPDQPPEARMMMLPITRLEVAPTVPSDEMVGSVRRMGVIQPIAVVSNGNHAEPGWVVAAGRRRVAAARLAEQTHIPAMVYPAGTPIYVAAAMALTENTHRGPNPVTDFDAIQEMVRAGATEEQIAHELRISLNTLRARMRLGNLVPDLRRAVDEGRVGLSVADRAARLDPARQQRLVDLLTETGRVRAQDVRDVTAVRRQEQIDALPEDVFTRAMPEPMGAADAPLPAIIRRSVAEVRISPSAVDGAAYTLEGSSADGTIILDAGQLTVAQGTTPPRGWQHDPEQGPSQPLETGWPLIGRLLRELEAVLPADGDTVSDVAAGCVSEALAAVELHLSQTTVPTPTPTRRPRRRAR